MTKRKRSSVRPPVAEAEPVEPNGSAPYAPGLPETIRARFFELSRLEADWDSYGALPPAPRSLTMAQSIIARTTAQLGGRGVPTDVMPIADGGIQVEWRGRSRELALNAAPDGSWSYLLIEHTSGDRAYTERYGLVDDEAIALAISFLGQ